MLLSSSLYNLCVKKVSCGDEMMTHDDDVRECVLSTDCCVLIPKSGFFSLLFSFVVHLLLFSMVLFLWFIIVGQGDLHNIIYFRIKSL